MTVVRTVVKTPLPLESSRANTDFNRYDGIGHRLKLVPRKNRVLVICESMMCIAMNLRLFKVRVVDSQGDILSAEMLRHQLVSLVVFVTWSVSFGVVRSFAVQCVKTKTQTGRAA